MIERRFHKKFVKSKVIFPKSFTKTKSQKLPRSTQSHVDMCPEKIEKKSTCQNRREIQTGIEITETYLYEKYYVKSIQTFRLQIAIGTSKLLFTVKSILLFQKIMMLRFDIKIIT